MNVVEVTYDKRTTQRYEGELSLPDYLTEDDIYDVEYGCDEEVRVYFTREAIRDMFKNGDLTVADRPRRRGPRFAMGLASLSWEESTFTEYLDVWLTRAQNGKLLVFTEVYMNLDYDDEDDFEISWFSRSW